MRSMQLLFQIEFDSKSQMPTTRSIKIYFDCSIFLPRWAYNSSIIVLSISLEHLSQFSFSSLILSVSLMPPPTFSNFTDCCLMKGVVNQTSLSLTSIEASSFLGQEKPAWPSLCTLFRIMCGFTKLDLPFSSFSRRIASISSSRGKSSSSSEQEKLSEGASSCYDVSFSRFKKRMTCWLGWDLVLTVNPNRLA